jgi:hypothetical protein
MLCIVALVLLTKAITSVGNRTLGQWFGQS